ncbi:hypothetical protein AYM40_35350 [Paraburkholderia phytofirmans OLGA172]|uniref:Uncharacterized protein n=1 Tax=Paraburkholderia phytofirmans OLGA172 TaxID=1417228 RepID=A0A160FVY9_9BURK|nr:hypothetical protein [Paraburkholderia phytofirmans]ANB77354.1 hypothetical protein AYM40_35350 [Paraburkholderia phytofirmans OLGA172]
MFATQFRYWWEENTYLAEIQMENSAGDEFAALYDPDVGIWKVWQDEELVAVIGGSVHPDEERGLGLGIFLMNFEDAVKSLVAREVKCGYFGWPARRHDTRGRRPEPDGSQSITTGHTSNLDGWYARDGEYELVLMPDSSLIARIGGAEPANAADGTLRWRLDDNARFELTTRTNWDCHPAGNLDWIYRLALAIVASQHVGDVNWRDWQI